jgi:hypothetical protein
VDKCPGHAFFVLFVRLFDQLQLGTHLEALAPHHKTPQSRVPGQTERIDYFQGLVFSRLEHMPHEQMRPGRRQSSLQPEFLHGQLGGLPFFRIGDFKIPAGC